MHNIIFVPILKKEYYHIKILVRFCFKNEILNTYKIHLVYFTRINPLYKFSPSCGTYTFTAWQKYRAFSIKARDIYNEDFPLNSQVLCFNLGKIANYAFGKGLVSI
jgi:hypothetical protein